MFVPEGDAVQQLSCLKLNATVGILLSESRRDYEMLLGLI